MNKIYVCTNVQEYMLSSVMLYEFDATYNIAVIAAPTDADIIAFTLYGVKLHKLAEYADGICVYNATSSKLYKCINNAFNRLVTRSKLGKLNE